MDNKTIKNILVVRNDRFGEFLLNIPALRALKETFINARLTALVDPYVKELAGSIPFIDEVICWQAKRHSLVQTLKFIKLLRKKRFDIAVVLNPGKELHIITALSGIPIRVGYNRKCGFLLTHKIEDKKHLAEKHEIEYNLQLVSLIGAGTDNLALSLNINNDIIKQSKSFLEFSTVYPEERSDEGSNRIVIAIHPWTSDPVKQWPLDNFYELAKRLTTEIPGLKIIIVGGKEEEQKDKSLFRDPENRIVNLTGKTSLLQLAAVLKMCKLLISADSGPVHLACSVGTPVLAIFRNDIPGKSPARWGPRGKNSFIIAKNSLEDIKVEEVFNKAKEILLDNRG